jgi:hypothetical protein
VESKIDFEFVKSFDENALIQGWYFYRSMPIDKLTALLLSVPPSDPAPNGISLRQEDRYPTAECVVSPAIYSVN